MEGKKVSELKRTYDYHYCCLNCGKNTTIKIEKGICIVEIDPTCSHCEVSQSKYNTKMTESFNDNLRQAIPLRGLYK